MPPGEELRFTGVTKRFGAITAVDDLTATVRPGAVTGFLGPNGAGKTTTLRILLGLVAATSGTATVGGVAYRELKQPLRAVGAALEASSFHPGRSGRGHLRVYARAAGLPDSRVDEVLELVGLTDAADRKVGGYSLGMRQRLGLAFALLGDPGVLMLDEPVNGLDPEGIRWMRGLMQSLAREGRTVLVSSHLLSEVQQTADQLLIIARGRLVFEGGLGDLVDPDEERTIFDGPDRAALSAAMQAAGIEVEVLRSGLTARQVDPVEVGRAAAAAGAVLSSLQRRGPSLEEAFLGLVDGTRAPRARGGADAEAAGPSELAAPAVEAPLDASPSWEALLEEAPPVEPPAEPVRARSRRRAEDTDAGPRSFAVAAPGVIDVIPVAAQPAPGPDAAPAPAPQVSAMPVAWSLSREAADETVDVGAAATPASVGPDVSPGGPDDGSEEPAPPSAPDADRGPEPEPGPGPDAEREPEPDAEPKPELEPVVETDPDSEPVPHAEPEPDAESEPEPGAGPETQSEPDAQPAHEPIAEPEYEPDAELEPEAGPGPEPVPDEPESAPVPHDPEPDAQPEPEPEPEPDAEPGPETGPVPDPVPGQPETAPVPADSEPDAQPEPEPIAEPEYEPDAEPGPETGPGPAPVPDEPEPTLIPVDPEPVPDAEPESEPDSTPQPMPGPQPEAEPASGSEPQPDDPVATTPASPDSDAADQPDDPAAEPDAPDDVHDDQVEFVEADLEDAEDGLSDEDRTAEVVLDENGDEIAEIVSDDGDDERIGGIEDLEALLDAGDDDDVDGEVAVDEASAPRPARSATDEPDGGDPR